MPSSVKRVIRAIDIALDRAAVWTARALIHVAQDALGYLDERLARLQSPLQGKGRHGEKCPSPSGDISGYTEGRPIRFPVSADAIAFAGECRRRRGQQRRFFRRRLTNALEYAQDVAEVNAERESAQISG